MKPKKTRRVQGWEKRLMARAQAVLSARVFEEVLGELWIVAFQQSSWAVEDLSDEELDKWIHKRVRGYFAEQEFRVGGRRPVRLGDGAPKVDEADRLDRDKMLGQTDPRSMGGTDPCST